MCDLINFSIKRTLAIASKEFSKIKLDPTTLGMLLAIPIIQIIIFGYAIELFPKHLPTAVINYDESPLTRRFIQALQSTNYFQIYYGNETEENASHLFKQGKINYIITIPPQFTRDLVRGNKPHILLEADASSPGVMGGTVQAVEELQSTVYTRELQGALQYLQSTGTPFITDIHAAYNPNLLSTHTIIPALLGVILMLSLSMITATVIIEEKEAGNIEVLLNSHIKPLEIMLGKFIAYVLIGYLQLITVLLISAYVLFDLPIRGSITVFLIVSFPYIMSNLMLGLAASTIALNQLQATQYVTFFFLPSFLLSGFIFPFYGMPQWAQIVGNALPMTHYIRITSGIMLKDYGWVDIFPDLWPIIVFVIIITVIAILTFRRTLD